MSANTTDRTYTRILFALALTSPLTWAGIGLASALLLTVACLAVVLAYAVCIGLLAWTLAEALANATMRRVWTRPAVMAGIVFVELTEAEPTYPQAIPVPVAVAIPEAIQLPTEARRIALPMCSAPESAPAFTTCQASAWDRVVATASTPASETVLTVAACSPSESSPAPALRPVMVNGLRLSHSTARKMRRAELVALAIDYGHDEDLLAEMTVPEIRLTLLGC